MNFLCTITKNENLKDYPEYLKNMKELIQERKNLKTESKEL